MNGIIVPAGALMVWVASNERKESEINAIAIAVDLPESVFQLDVADSQWKIVERRRLTRSQLERWFLKRAVGLVVMGSLRIGTPLSALAEWIVV